MAQGKDRLWDWRSGITEKVPKKVSAIETTDEDGNPIIVEVKKGGKGMIRGVLEQRTGETVRGLVDGAAVGLGNGILNMPGIARPVERVSDVMRTEEGELVRVVKPKGPGLRQRLGWMLQDMGGMSGINHPIPRISDVEQLEDGSLVRIKKPKKPNYVVEGVKAAGDAIGRDVGTNVGNGILDVYSALKYFGRRPDQEAEEPQEKKPGLLRRAAGFLGRNAVGAGKAVAEARAARKEAKKQAENAEVHRGIPMEPNYDVGEESSNDTSLARRRPISGRLESGAMEMKVDENNVIDLDPRTHLREA